MMTGWLLEAGCGVDAGVSASVLVACVKSECGITATSERRARGRQRPFEGFSLTMLSIRD